MKSKELFQRACQVIPGGVNSPVRAFNSVGGTPVFMKSGKGSRITTADDKELTDFCGSWGPLILGHAREEVVDAISKTAANGTTFGANTALEVEFAELLCQQVPYMDMVRLVNSGTEAVMTALRLARGITKRQKVIKFNGGYHGHSDSLLVAAGSGLLTGGIANSAGVPQYLADDLFLPHYNDLQAVNDIVSKHGDDIAAIIVEPIAGNMGLVAPETGFLKGLRDAADQCGAMLIFDEVITGFRTAATTYGNICGITPDITCLGKVIGGGLPIGGLGASRQVMEQLAPNGPVYQAGTLSGNPVAVAAGMTTIKLLIKENPYPRLALLGEKLATGVNQAAHNHNIAMHCACKGGVFTPFFRKDAVYNLTHAQDCDLDLFATFYHGMLNQGFYLPPSQFETAFISAAHNDDDVERFINAVDNQFANMALK